MPGKLILIFGVLWFPLFAPGQSASTLMGARSAALGYASGGLADEWALFNNVAGLATLKSPSVAFAYEANPSLPGADRIAAGFSLPSSIGTTGIGLFRFGDQLYSEQLISAGFANKFGLAALGVKLNYIQYRAEGFSTRSALSINVGGIAEITPQLKVGAYIVNLNQPDIAAQDGEQLPTKLVTGILVDPTPNISLMAEVEKDLDFDPIVKGAIEYRLYKKIQWRTGFNINPRSFFTGLGYHTSRLQIDYGVQFNPVLQTVHQISSTYKIPTKK